MTITGYSGLVDKLRKALQAAASLQAAITFLYRLHLYSGLICPLLTVSDGMYDSMDYCYKLVLSPRLDIKNILSILWFLIHSGTDVRYM